MNIQEISLGTYKNMVLDEKINFYKQINKNYDFVPATRLRKTKNIKQEGTKQKNGRLTFIAELKRIDKKVTNFYYLCICECGNWHILENSHFDKEDIISCGCYKKEKNIELMTKLGSSQYIDLTGMTFGELTVLEKTNQRIHESIVWKCKCNTCGHIQLVNGYMLRKGRRSFCEKCSLRKSKGEREISALLDMNNISYIKEKIFDNCRFADTNNCAIFDFYIENKYIIEYDGEQHFSPQRFNNITEKEAQINFIRTQEHDKYKNEWCKKNNIPLIRIPFTHFNNLCFEDLLPESSQFLL